MLRLLLALLPTFRSALRSRRYLVVENLALRQQLITLAGRRRPDLRPADWLLWILPSRLWSGRAETLAIVEPDIVVRWHRAGFRIYWNWLSRRGKRSGRSPLPREVRALIRRMATENPRGAPRIHGELLCLGFEVSERSVSPRCLPRTPRHGQTWTTFRLFQVLFIIRHGRREVVRCAVTTSPTAAWVALQLRDAFPFEMAPRFMVFDHGTTFTDEVMATLRSLQAEPTRTSYRSPWQNGVAERFVGTVRRELLNHVMMLNEHHLRRLLGSFVDHYNQDRTHLGASKDSPFGRPVEHRPAGATSNVVSLPRVGGLHHRYAWRRAA
jgi:transposase InsO family protein